MLSESVCCKKGQKSPNQETGLRNRGRLKVLNDVLFSPNQFLSWDFFFRFLQQDSISATRQLRAQLHTYYRLNHSCASNAEANWNKEESAREIRAVRKIKKGEEITINYFRYLQVIFDEIETFFLQLSRPISCLILI